MKRRGDSRGFRRELGGHSEQPEVSLEMIQDREYRKRSRVVGGKEFGLGPVWNLRFFGLQITKISTNSG